MANLSSYIDFSVVLDKSDANNPVIRLTDPNNYPVPVGLYLTGIFSITQPDGISVDGSFTDPDIYWSGASLVSATKELRLSDDTVPTFQNGVYTITYTIDSPGYDTTTLTKSFTLSYTAKEVIITPLVDVFTPAIQAIDGTLYVQSGFTLSDTTRSWSADIEYTGGATPVPETVTSTQLLFDMVYGGKYYDAHYAITLGVVVTYSVDGYLYLTLKDGLSASATIDAYTPPTLAALRLSLNSMYSSITNGTWCGSKCGCDPDYTPYNTAQSLYDYIVQNGQDGNTTGLDAYVWQLEKLFNCNGVLNQTHTNAEIPAYDWGTTQTFSLHPPIQFTVGSGGQYVPANGDTSYDNPTLAGNNSYLIYVQGEAAYLVEGTDFSYQTTGGFTLINRSFIDSDRWTLSFYA